MRKEKLRHITLFRPALLACICLAQASNWEEVGVTKVSTFLVLGSGLCTPSSCIFPCLIFSPLGQQIYIFVTTLTIQGNMVHYIYPRQGSPGYFKETEGCTTPPPPPQKKNLNKPCGDSEEWFPFLINHTHNNKN